MAVGEEEKRAIKAKGKGGGKLGHLVEGNEPW